MRAWLEDPGSFMHRLEQFGVQDADIEVIHEDWEMPLPEEAVLLSLPAGQPALIREVLIHSGKRYWMFARTVFPKNTLTGEQQALGHLGNRPLGSLLFQDPTLKRSPFEIMRLPRDTPRHQMIDRLLHQTLPNLWSRRSILSVHDKSLLLTEVFLPDIESLQIKK